MYCPAWQLYLGMGILNDYKTTAILPISPHSANQCTLPQCHCYDHPTAMPRARIPASDISFFMPIHIYCSDITYHVRMSNICAMPCIFVYYMNNILLWSSVLFARIPIPNTQFWYTDMSGCHGMTYTCPVTSIMFWYNISFTYICPVYCSDISYMFRSQISEARKSGI